MSAEYIPWAQRPGWEDLKPIPQKDCDNPLVPIAYSEQYRDAMDTFRAIVQGDEKSTRGLTITEVLIRLNPGHYSIWTYRYQTLLAIQSDLAVELDLMDELIKEHLKSYQVWQHRRNIVTALNSSTRELGFTSKALSYDSKNYHTWAYRQWVLCHFFASSPVTAPSPSPSASSSTSTASIITKEEKENVWKGEIKYSEKLLEEDVRNNSAWNHRFFIAFESGEGGSDSTAITKREIRYTKEKLAVVPNNPSAWNYLRGILNHSSTPFSSPSHHLIPFVSLLAGIPATATDDSEQKGTDDPLISSKAQLPAWLAIEFLADALDQDGKGREAGILYKSLIEFDPIREKYWLFRAGECEAKVL